MLTEAACRQGKVGHREHSKELAYYLLWGAWRSVHTCVYARACVTYSFAKRRFGWAFQRTQFEVSMSLSISLAQGSRFDVKTVFIHSV